MKKQKKYRFRLKYGIVGLVAILFVLLIPFQAEAKEKSNEKVRVGFYRLDGYHMQDEDGNRSGYGYEFLQKIVRKSVQNCRKHLTWQLYYDKIDCRIKLRLIKCAFALPYLASHK